MMRLQGIGMVEGTEAGKIQIGDVLRWNNGGLSRVAEIEFTKTGKTIICKMEYINYKGEIETAERKMRVTREVNIVASGNTVLTSEYSFKIVEEKIEAAEVEAAPAPKEEAKKEMYFQTIEQKHQLQAMYSKHSDFYHEVIWYYSSSTLEAMRNELEKISDAIKNCEASLKDMRAENGWNLEKLKEMREQFYKRGA